MHRSTLHKRYNKTNNYWRNRRQDVQKKYWGRQEPYVAAYFRVFAGHDILGKRLHLFAITPTRICILCYVQKEVDRTHLLHLEGCLMTDRYSETRKFIFEHLKRRFSNQFIHREFNKYLRTLWVLRLMCSRTHDIFALYYVREIISSLVATVSGNIVRKGSVVFNYKI